ncbi:MFS transporter [Planococcus sp. CP5-4]|uniref:MFS transporter n=1 Tax=unclassified Planococcus (in: firmicutes) TaxID=2662419 RepID=UPI001C214565|nr:MULTISPECIES: MFS transporter [unclassified Planococcus (in: firmicutes)]MBU9673328.1 MFS transporter [Planococcus sp. CP5-4_YE]MBV0908101.1 MFS transporter [Planococcus sp. CP5-4_UN]MBW6062162.1 MFS transporter [Planococcus sp. CP5-4]
MKKIGKDNEWREVAMLLTGIGIANFGGWVYLIALNLIVLDMTGSALAVAGLYIVKPAATLLTNFWAGSVIDRTNQRNLMIVLDVLRALLITCLPFASSLWLIYAFVLLINMAGSMFEPASMSYITKLIPVKNRQRFNAFRSLIDSGAFLIGPAVAGVLFMMGTPVTAIYLNAVALLISALILRAMPKLEQKAAATEFPTRMSWEIIRADWRIVIAFSKRYVLIMTVFFLFSCMTVMATAIDSQEATFSKRVLGLTDGEYGFLVSIAGAGIIAGAIVNTVFTKKLGIAALIGGGSVMVSLGYLLYAFSSSFAVAAIGFFILAFSLAFANTGFHTFTQNNIPVEVMGRTVSVYSLLEALLIIITTAIIGLASEIVTVQPVVIASTAVMFGISLLLLAVSFKQSKTSGAAEVAWEGERPST